MPLAVFRRPTSSLARLDGLDAADFVGSYDDLSGMLAAADGCATVYNLAAATSLLSRDRDERERLNAVFPRRLAEALIDRGWPGRLVHCSTVGAVGLSDEPRVLDETSPFTAGHIHYCETKRRGEEAVLRAAARGLDAVVVNPATLLSDRGLRDSQRVAFEKAAYGRLAAYPPGGTSICWADDVAAGMAAAARSGRRGQRYILGGENVTFADYFRAIAKAAGVRPPRLRIPGRLMPALGALSETLRGTMGADMGRFAAAYGWYSSEKARRELGYIGTPLAEIVGRMLRASTAGRG